MLLLGLAFSLMLLAWSESLAFIYLIFFLSEAKLLLRCASDVVTLITALVCSLVGLYCSITFLTVVVICCSNILLFLALMSSSLLPTREAATLYPVPAAVPPVMCSMSLMLFSSLWKKTMAWTYVWFVWVLCFHLHRTECRNTPLL